LSEQKSSLFKIFDLKVKRFRVIFDKFRRSKARALQE